MNKLEDEFVNHSINAYRTANKLEVSVSRNVEDETVAVKAGQLVTAKSSSQLAVTSQTIVDMTDCSHWRKGLLFY